LNAVDNSGAGLRRQASSSTTAGQGRRRVSVAWLVLLAAAVVALYGLKLEHTPPHLQRDEVVFALQAHSIASTARDVDGRLLPLYFEMRALGEHTWFHPVLVYVTALFLTVLPLGESAIRFPSVIVGTIDVLLMYFIARRLFHTEGWAFFAAALLALTPAHVMHSRLAMDFIYPLPFVMAWLLVLLIFLDRRKLLLLFLATSFLGVGFFTYIASVIMMPVYLLITGLALWTTSTRSARPYAVAFAGFVWPLLVAAPWLAFHWSFVTDTLAKYQIGGSTTGVPVVLEGPLGRVLRGIGAGLRPSMIAERLSLYWRFFDPAYLFVTGGFARMTNSTRHVGLFLLPFLVFVPLGLIQMVTVRRTVVSMLLFLGFAMAPLAACLTVLEAYASDRELVLLPFGVLIAAFGVERLLALRSRAGRASAMCLLALLPVHFLFFEADYFGDYHRRAAFWFDWNHRGALEEIIARDAHGDRPIYLSKDDDAPIEAHWRLAVLKHHREDLLRKTVYFNSRELDIATVPTGALVMMKRNDEPFRSLVSSGQLRELAAIPEPADPPFYVVAER
jgi:4-amino-4-deoxy-L-arabinose transferase-like glycosyltransferase